MKICRHLRDFLEQKEYLELPAVGRFDLFTESMSMPKGEVLINKKLSFSPSRKTGFDDALVDFLCQRLQAEASVVYSDIQSFSSAINELLMQGFEAEIPGIGFLNQNGNSGIQFTYQSSYKKRTRLKKAMPAYFMSYWM